MKTLNKCCFIMLLTIVSSNLFAQESKQIQTPEEKAWMTYMTPGKMHEMLAKSVGLWNEEVTMWMAPDAPPMKSTLNCMNKMIMGNRYLQGMSRGQFSGMPFEGISTIAYDNAKNIFVSTWIDNMGTGISYSEGKWNDASKSIEFIGTMVDPMSGKDLKFRQVMKFKDDDNQSMEMYSTTATGKEYKSMDIKMTRRQNPNMNNNNTVKQVPAAPPATPDDKK